MKKKKVLAMLLVTAMAVSAVITGCGSGSGGSKETAADNTGSSENTTAETEAGQETAAPEAETIAEDDTADAGESTGSADKIIIFQSKVEIIDQLEVLAEDYKEETGVEVEIWGTTGDDYFQQLKTKLANNQGPTIYNTAGGTELEQLQDYMIDLSDTGVAAVMNKELFETGTGTELLGLPYTMEGFGLVYNKDLIDASALTSSEDFIAMLKEQQENGIMGFGLSSESYFLIGHILNTPFALQDDPEQFVADLEAGKVKMADNEIFREFAELYAAIREYSYNPLEYNYDKECGDFATGKTAAIHQGNWCYSMFEDYDEVNMGLAPLPLAGNDKITALAPSYWSVNSTASAEEQQAGKEFLDWLYTSETGKNYLYNEMGFLPLIEGDTSDNLNPLSEDVQTYVTQNNMIGNPNNLWPAGIVDVYLVPVAEEFFTTDMTAEAFLTALDEAWEQASAE